MTRILIIDGERGYLHPIGGSLRRAGIEVEEAECVVSGLQKAHASPPDLIVTAERLPGLDAVDLLELRRDDATLDAVSVLVVGQSPTRKLECFRLGCDDFVVLPVDESELFFRICAILRRAGNKGVRGSLSDISIIDLIQMLVASRRSGRLEIETPQLSGLLYFKEGHVFHADADGQEGEDGFLKILRHAVRGGTFSFVVDEAGTFTPTIQKRTDHLLLGLASALDEEGA